MPARLGVRGVGGAAKLTKNVPLAEPQSMFLPGECMCVVGLRVCVRYTYKGCWPGDMAVRTHPHAPSQWPPVVSPAAAALSARAGGCCCPPRAGKVSSRKRAS